MKNVRMRNQWAFILAFSFGVVIVATSLFLGTLGAQTGFWLVTGIGFTLVAAALVLDGQTGTSNPRISRKPVVRSRLSETVVATAVAFIKNSRKR
jgi:hypothetical protein